MPLAKEHLVTKEKEDIKDDKQAISRRCDKRYISVQTSAFQHCSMVVKKSRLHVSLPRYKPWFHHLLAV